MRKFNFENKFLDLLKEYKFTVENSALHLTDITDGTVTVYMAYTPAETSAPETTTVA